MSVKNTVTLTTSASVACAASSTSVRLSSTRRVSRSMPPVTSSPVSGSSGICPDTNTNLSARTALEYEATGVGMRSERITVLGMGASRCELGALAHRAPAVDGSPERDLIGELQVPAVRHAARDPAQLDRLRCELSRQKQRGGLAVHGGRRGHDHLCHAVLADALEKLRQR